MFIWVYSFFITQTSARKICFFILKKSCEYASNLGEKIEINLECDGMVGVNVPNAAQHGALGW